MSTNDVFHSYPWKVLVGTMVGCMVVMGLLPTRWTLIALDVGLTATGVALTIRFMLRQTQRDRSLVLREPDGRPLSLSLAILMLPLCLFVGLVFTMMLFASWSPAPETACLCARLSGLESALTFGVIAVFIAVGHTAVIVVILSSLTRIAQSIRPRTGA